jgi:hypothetical protein
MTHPWFELRVTVAGRPPARRLFQAENLEAALQAAKQQHPNAEVEVPEQVAKPELVRSSAGRKEILRRIRLQLR